MLSLAHHLSIRNFACRISLMPYSHTSSLGIRLPRLNALTCGTQHLLCLSCSSYSSLLCLFLSLLCFVLSLLHSLSYFDTNTLWLLLSLALLLLFLLGLFLLVVFVVFLLCCLGLFCLLFDLLLLCWFGLFARLWLHFLPLRYHYIFLIFILSLLSF